MHGEPHGHKEDGNGFRHCESDVKASCAPKVSMSIQQNLFFSHLMVK